MAFRRLWDGNEWQAHALRLVQVRHGAQNVQIVPDKVRGDAGLEFFTLDGCLYQCYAPEEVADVRKAASGMKAKASRDLKKLEKNKTVIASLLQSIKAKRWILLCPFLDDKQVIVFVRKLAEKLKLEQLEFLAEDFEALVHSQEDFTAEIKVLRLRSLGPLVKAPAPTPDDVQAASEGILGLRLREKLQRAFPAESSEQRHNRIDAYIRSLLARDNTLEALRVDHPILWERSKCCLDTEERRLVALGALQAQPTAQLAESLQRIEQSLKQDLPEDLSAAKLTEISLGTVADWLIRCPLDFTSTEGS